LAGSDDEDYGAQNRKPAAQEEASQDGGFLYEAFFLCVLVVYLLRLQVNPTIS
jgi:hypothetical protein